MGTMYETSTGNEWTNGPITPSDTTTYDVNKMIGILVVSTGNLVLVDSQGNQITLSSVAANSILPLKPKKIKAATTAGVVILYK
jgi:hypothetical protein